MLYTLLDANHIIYIKTVRCEFVLACSLFLYKIGSVQMRWTYKF